MTIRESNHPGRAQPHLRRRGFADSHAFFALFVVCTFAVAITFALVGLTISPGWLGFS
jgi:hypothetical protein